MASTVVLAPVEEAILGRVRALVLSLRFEMDGAGTKRALTVYAGVATQPPTYPYVVVGDSSSSRPFHTLGPASGPKFGGTVRVPIRIITQYPTTQAQTYRMLEPIQAGLDGQRVDVVGFGSPIVTLEDAVLLTDTINGVVTRELLTECDVVVHQ